MPVTNDDLLVFMRAMYTATKGRLMTNVSMWDIGAELGWDRKRTSMVEDRLSAKRLIKEVACGGSIVLTTEGLVFCEESFGCAPGRQEARLALLRAIYDRSDGSTRAVVSLFAIAEGLGMERQEAGDAFHYLSDLGYLEGRGIGGALSLTELGVEFVERELLGARSLEDLVVSARGGAAGEQDAWIAHTDERRYAFFSVDVCDHSRLLKNSGRDAADRTLRAFRALVEKEVATRLGRQHTWEGDGGVCMFNGSGCQRRAAEAALAIRDQMRAFNQTANQFGEPVHIRIAVHTGFFAMPDDPGDLHDASLNLAAKLQEAAPADAVCVSRDVFLEMDEQARSRFRSSPKMSGDCEVYLSVDPDLWVVSLHASTVGADSLLLPALAPASYPALCDWLEENLAEQLEACSSGYFALCEASDRDGEGVAVRYAAVPMEPGREPRPQELQYWRVVDVQPWAAVYAEEDASEALTRLGLSGTDSA